MYIICCLRLPGFDHSFENLVCLATLKSCDNEINCRWMKLHAPQRLSPLGEDVTVVTHVRQGSSNEFSSR